MKRTLLLAPFFVLQLAAYAQPLTNLATGQSVALGAQISNVPSVAGGGGGTSPGTANLAAWWDFNDNQDSHSSNRDLTESGTPTYTGGYGQAVNTTVCWTRANDGGDLWTTSLSDKAIVARFRIRNLSPNGFVWVRSSERDKLQWSSGNALSGSITSFNSLGSFTVSANTWYTIVFQCLSDGTRLMYINDSLHASGSQTQATASGDWTFGGRSTTLAVDVDFDFIAIYNGRVLSADNRTWLYNSGNTRTYSQL